MTPDELARIAVARYGPHGWKSKLAEYLGVDPKTVWRYRRGRTPIDDRTAMAVQALEIGSVLPEACPRLPPRRSISQRGVRDD